MTPELMNTLNSLLGPAVLALITFALGHFHVLLKNPSAPSVPGAPTLPSVQLSPVGQGGILQGISAFDQGLHAAPGSQIAPVGQGGILQYAGMTLQAIMTGAGTPAQKAAAASQITEATSTLLAQKAGA